MKNSNLLASSATLDGIQRCITKFCFGASKTLVPTGENSWKIVDTYDGAEIPNLHVIRKAKRFRFERKAKTDGA